MDWTPTDCPPGSEGKLAVMEARAAAGLPVFHPGDAAGAVTPQRARGRQRVRGGWLLRGLRGLTPCWHAWSWAPGGAVWLGTYYDEGEARFAVWRARRQRAG